MSDTSSTPAPNPEPQQPGQLVPPQQPRQQGVPAPQQPAQPNYGQPTYAPPTNPQGGYPPKPGYGAPGYQQQGGYQQGGYQQSGYQQQPGYPQQPGYQQPPFLQPGYPRQKSRLAAGLFGIFLGTFGVHRFYLGYTGIAIVQLLITVLSLGFLAWVSSLWGLIEGILILARSGNFATDARGIPLRD